MAQRKAEGPILQVSHVDIEYRAPGHRVRATHDVSFDVWPGDRFILLGPSGCGKSSLLKAVGGFQPVSNGQIYLDDQGGIACKDGDFAIPETLKDMRPYIENNRMADYQDHHYPSEMSVDAMIQTFLLDTSDNAQEKFLKKFDSGWKRYNRDLIRKVQDYQKEQEDAQ